MHETLAHVKPEEFVEPIIDQLRTGTSLKYPPAGYFTSFDGECTALRNLDLPLRQAVSAEVLHTITALRRIVPKWEAFNDRRTNRDQAKKLGQALVTIETLLASAPKQLDFFLFLEDGLDWTKMGMERILEHQQAAKTRRAAFSDMLRNMRKRCARGPTLGNHPNFDLAAKLCVRLAAELMQNCSLESRLTMGANTRLHLIACLLYEATTGSAPSEQGLLRACNAYVRRLQTQAKKTSGSV
jgi:hypothetical protein